MNNVPQFGTFGESNKVPVIGGPFCVERIRNADVGASRVQRTVVPREWPVPINL